MNKQYLGVALFSVGVGTLVYLYYGFYVPRNETKKAVTATTTK
jgi:hypothetical protein